VRVKHQQELQAINSVEQQDKDIDDDNNRRGNLSGKDVHKPLASIDEEEQRHSGQTTPNVHPKVVIVIPSNHNSEKLKIGQFQVYCSFLTQPMKTV
jgi:hypothetical protein